MEIKQGRAVTIFPEEGDGPTELDFELEEVLAAIRQRQLKALGKSGFPAAALKKMVTMLSIVVLKDVIVKMGRLPYIKLILRFVAHLPIRKAQVVSTEEGTGPIAVAEEGAKVIAIMSMNRTEQYVANS